MISSQIKTKRVTALITKLMERKKRLESLEGIGSQPVPVEEEKPNSIKNKSKPNKICRLHQIVGN